MEEDKGFKDFCDKLMYQLEYVLERYRTREKEDAAHRGFSNYPTYLAYMIIASSQSYVNELIEEYKGYDLDGETVIQEFIAEYFTNDFDNIIQQQDLNLAQLNFIHDMFYAAIDLIHYKEIADKLFKDVAKQ